MMLSNNLIHMWQLNYIFSFCFAGTLNPALQDQAGKPKRSINTIVHILNDLLGATPEYAAYYGSRAPAAHREYTMSHRHKSSHSNRFARKGKLTFNSSCGLVSSQNSTNYCSHIRSKISHSIWFLKKLCLASYNYICMSHCAHFQVSDNRVMFFKLQFKAIQR